MMYPCEIEFNLEDRTISSATERKIQLKEAPIIIAVMKDQEEAERLTQ